MNLGRKVIFLVCLIVFVGSAAYLGNYFWQAHKAQSAFEDLSKVEAEQDLVTDKGIVIGKYVKLYKMNNEIIGWVKVDDTRINYPVMQSINEPEYYLHRNFNGEASAEGTPFMDAKSDIFKPTSNFMIYGHHMKNGTMFHDLLKYSDKDFYEAHKTFKFDTIYKGGQGEYQVVAACYSEIKEKTSTDFKYYEYAGIETEEEFNAYIRGIKQLSAYDTGVTPKYGDQLVTLSTCAYQTDNGRFFVVGVRVK